MWIKTKIPTIITFNLMVLEILANTFRLKDTKRMRIEKNGIGKI